jgi:hypothetical protein
MRVMYCASGISRLQMITRLPASAAWTAKFAPHQDFPIPSRAARVQNCPGPKPPVIRSSEGHGGVMVSWLIMSWVRNVSSERLSRSVVMLRAGA